MISVDDLVRLPSLGLSYLAGQAGGGRIVTWAHACDLPDPWKWFEPGDLVMTTGGGLPASAQRQAEWIAQLMDSGVSTLVVAPGPDAPAVTDAMLRVADAQGFPVLQASFDLQFVALARTVIESAIAAERTRLATIKRLYDAYWQSLHARGTLDDRLSALESCTGWALHVRSAAEGEVIGAGQAARSRLSPDPGDAVTIPIPGAADMQLIAASRAEPATNQPLLQHVGGLIALELEHHAAERDRQRASGEDLLLGLLDESITLSAMWPEMRHRGITADADAVAVCWRTAGDEPLDHEQIHHDVQLHGCFPLLSYRPPMLVGVVPSNPDLLARLATGMGSDCAAGFSLPLSPNSNLPEMMRQAQLAATRALETQQKSAGYAAATEGGGFLPRTVEDTRRLVRSVLGPLIDYDVANDTQLVDSVRAFLANDGNWRRTSEQLQIHRQTLVYRFRRVEEILGVSVTSTRGSATLWLALEAADQTRINLRDLIETDRR